VGILRRQPAVVTVWMTENKNYSYRIDSTGFEGAAFSD